ncbi:MAG: NAD-dependent epimerase/dehydratase family protein [Rhodothalassiaceae bacterium]
MREPVLVTGGAGFLGSRLVRLLHEAGLETLSLDIAQPPPDAPAAVVHHQGSLLDTATLMPLVARAGTIFHMAAVATLWQRDPALYDRVNHEGTERLLAAIRAAGGDRRLVVTSTALILRGWDDPDPRPVRIGDPTPPLTAMPGPYSRAKWRADAAVRHAVTEGLDAILLYPTVPIGPAGRHVTEPTDMIRRFLTNPPPAYLPTSLNLVDVEDAALAHLHAAERGVPGERFLLAGEDIAFERLLVHLAEMSGREMPRRKVPYALAATAAHLGEALARITGRPPAASIEGVRAAKHGRLHDGSEIRRRLDWTPRPIAQTLAAMVQDLVG